MALEHTDMRHDELFSWAMVAHNEQARKNGSHTGSRTLCVGCRLGTAGYYTTGNRHRQRVPQAEGYAKTITIPHSLFGEENRQTFRYPSNSGVDQG